MKAKTNARTKSFCKKSAAGILVAGMVMSAGVFTNLSAAAAGAKGYYPDFATYEDEQKAASDLNAEIFEESAVLLKNKDKALPLNNTLEKGLTVVGMRSYDTVTGGTGSGAASTSSDYCSITDSLELAGFRVNSKVKQIYENTTSQAAVSGGMMGGASNTTVEAPSSILASAEGSYEYYGDAAIWTIGRIGGEGADLMRSNLPTTADKTKHILELDDNEMDMLKYLKRLKTEGKLNKIVVLINSANVMEMGVLEDDPEVDAILWIGQPGNSGLKGLGRILNGEVNPSGKTVDIWAADFTHDPTWYNTGKMTHLGTDPDTNQPYSNYAYQKNADGTYTKITKELYGGRKDDKADGQIVEYEEGIYLGYKWYETAAVTDGVLTAEKIGYKAADAKIPADKNNDVYYNRSTGVVYPFGYGLSYTEFTKTIKTSAEALQAAINSASGLDARVKVQVEVKNTGKVAGKDVVQMYVNAPYYKNGKDGAGGIEKAEVSLVSYAKTDLLKPGETQTVTLDIRLGDIASFDYDDANNNNYKGYEIEAGDYEFRLQENSHKKIGSLNVTLEEKTTALDNDNDDKNNTPFSNGDDYDSLLNIKDKTGGEGRGGKMTILSREDFLGTFPSAPKASDMLYGDRVSKIMLILSKEAGTADEYERYSSYTTGSDDKTSDPWYRTESDIPKEWTQAADTTGRTDGKTAVQITDMIGIDYWSTAKITEGKFKDKTGVQAWTEFMNQLTYEELVTLCSSGGFSTPALDSIGKTRQTDADGPGKLSNGTFWCCEVNIASTWNTELAHRQGVMVGNESLFQGVTGWYAPSMNTHRTPFTGRNFEYYSQDGVQGGFIAAAVIEGYQSKGGVAYVKHYGLNDEEDNRLSGSSFVDEQTMRENYLKVFEYAFKDGGSIATMTAHTRIGAMSCYGNYALLQELTAGEWGWKGYAITDMYLTTSKGNFVVRAGSLPLGSFSGTNKLTGEWDASVTRTDGGRGAVRDSFLAKDAAEGTKMEISYTQWYAVRTTAMKVCWGATQSNSLLNANKTSLFSAKTFNLVQGVNASETIGVDTKQFGTDNVRYSVTTGALPQGLMLNEKTGAITGSPKNVTEETKVTVTLLADGWAKTTAELTFKVTPMVTVDGAETVKANTDYKADVKVDSAVKIVDTSTLTEAGQAGYTAISYSAENLPAGFAIDAATGAITGKTAKCGEYTVTVKVTLTYTSVESGKKGTSLKDSVSTQVQELKLTVTDENGEIPASHGGIISTVVNDNGELVITYEDGTTANLGVVVGSDGQNAESGCGGNIAVSAGLSIAALALIGAAVVLLRKKRNNG